MLQRLHLVRGNRGFLLLGGLLLGLAALYTIRHRISAVAAIPNYRILDEQEVVNFLSKYALYDNRDGKMAPYRLNNPNATDYSETGQKSTRILQHLNNLKGGTFLEAGAYDGEEASVTLALELHHGWTGILVEPVPWNFAKLKAKGRRALLLQACISPKPNPIKTVLTVDMVRYKSSGAITGYPVPPGTNKTEIHVICFPFLDILIASGLKKLDVLYLDVQGPEFDILRTIPFHFVDIKLIGIENISDGDPSTRAGFMKTAMDILGPHGYKNVDHLQNDYIFMKN